MRKAAALYPFCAELLPIAKHFEVLQSQYSLVELISPEGLGLVGKDAGYACNHPEVGILVSNALDLEKSSWDTLIVARDIDTKIIDADDKLNDIVERTLKAGKAVSFFAESETDIPPVIYGYTQIYPTKINFYIGEICSAREKAIYEQYGTISAPVVLIGGLVTEADVLEVLLQLTVQMRKDGLYPTVFTRSSIGKLFGFHSTSHIFNNVNLTESQKIVELNLLAKNLEASEMPDVILIEAPDAVMQFNDIAPNGFGIQTYMLGHAVPPDSFICCVPYLLGVGTFLDVVSTDLNARIGTAISAAHISNVLVDTAELLQTHEISYARATLGKVWEKIVKEKRNSNISMHNVVEDGIDGIYNLLEKE
jgi:peptide maturation system protein (TIGR04066 family)